MSLIGILNFLSLLSMTTGYFNVWHSQISLIPFFWYAKHRQIVEGASSAASFTLVFSSKSWRVVAPLAQQMRLEFRNMQTCTRATANQGRPS